MKWCPISVNSSLWVFKNRQFSKKHQHETHCLRTILLCRCKCHSDKVNIGSRSAPKKIQGWPNRCQLLNWCVFQMILQKKKKMNDDFFESSRFFQRPIPTPSNRSLVVIPLEVQSITRNSVEHADLVCKRVSSLLSVSHSVMLPWDWDDWSIRETTCWRCHRIGVCFLMSVCLQTVFGRGLHCSACEREWRLYLCKGENLCFCCLVWVGKSHSFSLLKSN